MFVIFNYFILKKTIHRDSGEPLGRGAWSRPVAPNHCLPAMMLNIMVFPSGSERPKPDGAAPNSRCWLGAF